MYAYLSHEERKTAKLNHLRTHNIHWKIYGSVWRDEINMFTWKIILHYFLFDTSFDTINKSRKYFNLQSSRNCTRKILYQKYSLRDFPLAGETPQHRFRESFNEADKHFRNSG